MSADRVSDGRHTMRQEDAPETLHSVHSLNRSIGRVVPLTGSSPYPYLAFHRDAFRLIWPLDADA